jgi:predicted AAA+ superfamily ATPase
MERKIDKLLKTWKESRSRLPLILQGARQVGKTFTLLQFGKKNYQNVAYFNFENSPELNMVFAKDISPEQLLPQLMLLSNQTIFEENTLIIFDEIQACERALTSLKLFCRISPRISCGCGRKPFGCCG